MHFRLIVITKYQFETHQVQTKYADMMNMRNIEFNSNNRTTRKSMINVNGKFNFLFVTIIFLVSLLNLSCQRAQESSSSNLQLSFASLIGSNNGAQSTLTLEHAIINVSGPGIQTIVITWDRKGSFNAENAVPASYNVEVLQGPSRLVQALAVYKETGSSDLNFYYGESEQDLYASDAVITLNTAKVGSATGKDGSVYGRYIFAGNETRSGKIKIKIKPSPVRAPMIVQESEMINGWFSLFALEGQAFEYYLEDTSGTTLFGQEMKLEDFESLSTTSSQSILAAHIPASYYCYSGTCSSSLSEEKTSVIGFFGPGSGSKYACYEYTASNTTVANHFLSPASGGSNPVYYNSSSTYGTPNIITRQGGTVSSDSNCSASNWISNINFKPSDSNSSWERRLSVPFLPNLSYSIPASGSAHIQWTYLPDLVTDVASHTIYAISSNALNFVRNPGGEGVDCEKLSIGAINYPDDVVIAYGTGAASTTTSSTSSTSSTTTTTIPSLTSYSIVFTTPILNSSNVSLTNFAICPVMNAGATQLPGVLIKY